MPSKWKNLLPWNWFKCCRKVQIPACGDAITEPITDILGDLEIKKSLGSIDTREYRIYQYVDGSFHEKECKQLMAFQTFATNKDFLSWLFGQPNQNDYKIYAGDHACWYLLSNTGIYHTNRIFKAVNCKTMSTYIILTNSPHRPKYFDTRGAGAEYLRERANLLKPPSKGFNPLPANAVL